MARVIVAYGLDVEAGLASLLPIENEETDELREKIRKERTILERSMEHQILRKHI